MEQVLEFLLVLAFGVRLCGPHDAHARGFEHARDVIGGSFPAPRRATSCRRICSTSAGVNRGTESSRAISRISSFLVGWIRMCHGDDLTGLDLFIAGAGAGAAG